MPDHDAHREAAPAGRSARFAARVGRLLLVLAPVLPLAAAAWILLAAGLPDYALDGDGALLESCVRNAAAGRQLVGCYSRYGFHHPGPLHLYLCVPLYEWTDGRAGSLNLSTVLLQASSAIAALALFARRGRLPLLVGGALATSLFVGQLGQVLITAWDPSMAILPSVLCVAAAAAFAGGASAALVPAVLAASLVTQAHLSLAPLACASLALAVVLRVAWRRETQPDPRLRRHVALAVGCGVVSALPPLIEQLRGDPGNLTCILRGLGAGGPGPDWRQSAAIGVEHLAAFARGVLRTDGSWNAALVALQLASLAMIAVRRRGDRGIRALAALALSLHAVTVVAAHRIVGPVQPHMLLWIHTVGALSWWAILAWLGAGLGRARRGPRTAAVVIAALALLLATLRASERLLAETLVFVGDPQAAAGTPGLPAVADRTAEVLRGADVHAAQLRVLPDPDGLPFPAGFVAAAGLANALEKRGIAVAPDPRQAFAWPAGRAEPPFPRATLVLFVGARRAELEAEGPFVSIADAVAWGAAIRLP